ncbi:hypothetical protein ACA910_004096 [Epithemia clementina (nom. ined.)]
MPETVVVVVAPMSIFVTGRPKTVAWFQAGPSATTRLGFIHDSGKARNVALCGQDIVCAIPRSIVNILGHNAKDTTRSGKLHRRWTVRYNRIVILAVVLEIVNKAGMLGMNTTINNVQDNINTQESAGLEFFEFD